MWETKTETKPLLASSQPRVSPILPSTAAVTLGHRCPAAWRSRCRLVLTTVSLLSARLRLIPSVTLCSIPAWPLWVSSASHSSNHSHWKALHLTGWPNTPTIRREGHRLPSTGTLSKRSRRLFLFFSLLFFSTIYLFKSIRLCLKGPLCQTRFNKDIYWRMDQACFRLVAAYFPS